MIYSAEITTVKNTAKTALKRTTLKITKGLVYKIEFYFPRGSAGLMGVAVFDGSYSIWPSTIGQFFSGDDVIISFDDMYLKEAAPFMFHIYTYNLDDTYNHLIHVRVGLVSKEVYLARFLPHIGYDYFASILNNIQTEQQQQAEQQRTQILETPFAGLISQG